MFCCKLNYKAGNCFTAWKGRESFREGGKKKLIFFWCSRWLLTQMWQCGQEKKKRGQVGNKKSALLPKYFLSISVNMTNIGCTRTGIKVEPNNQVFPTQVSTSVQFLWQGKINFFLQVWMDVLGTSFFQTYFLSFRRFTILAVFVYLVFGGNS